MTMHATIERGLASDYEFARQVRCRGWDIAFADQSEKPKRLTSFAWFNVLAVTAVVTGAALAFAS